MSDAPVSTAIVGETGPDVPVRPSRAVRRARRGQDDPAGHVPGSVLPAYLHGHRVSHSFHQSMMQLLIHDANGPQRLRAPFMIHCSGPNGLVEGRNLAVKHFLDESQAEWLWFVDTDMGFKPDTVDRLVQAADRGTRPVVGGLCFAMKQVQPDGYGGYVVRPIPTLFGLTRDANRNIGFLSRLVYPENSLVQVAGTGAACLLIHRSVLVALRAEMGENWFDLVSYENGKPISEDLSFCWRVGAMGYPVFVHTGVKTTHHKDVWLGEDQYQMPDEEPEYGRKAETHPADEEQP